MSYTDQTKRSSPASIAAVVGVHLVIAYALISGLAYKVVRHIPIITATEFLEDPPPPPPTAMPVERSKVPTTLTTPLPKPQSDELKTPETIVRLSPPADFGSPAGGGTIEPVFIAPPTQPSLARDAVAGADRLRWITTDDYPSAALRQGIAGTVVISATIGTDGRVRSCEVTKSSGSQLLDDTTCRLYTRRAHFTPAQDADGNAVAARRTDRFRWQIPND
jgi:protein TonB